MSRTVTTNTTTTTNTTRTNTTTNTTRPVNTTVTPSPTPATPAPTSSSSYAPGGFTDWMSNTFSVVYFTFVNLCYFSVLAWWLDPILAILFNKWDWYY